MLGEPEGLASIKETSTHIEREAQREIRNIKCLRSADLLQMSESQPQINHHFSVKTYGIAESPISAGPNFKCLRDFCISTLHSQIRKMLQTLYNNHLCEYADVLEELLPHNVFSWKRSQFIERRKIGNTIWINVLRQIIPANCLEVQKLKVDLTELIRMYDAFFAAIFEDATEEMHEMPAAFTDVTDLLMIEDNLRDDLAKNEKVMQDLKHDMKSLKLDKLSFDRNDKLEDAKNWEHNLFLDAVEFRYHKRYNDEMVNQAEIVCEDEEKKLTKEIERYKNLMDPEKNASQCTLGACYATIEGYKIRMQQISEEYNSELERVENSIRRKNALISNINLRKKIMMDQIQKFRIAIEKVQEKERKQTEWQMEENALEDGGTPKRERKSKSVF